MKNIKILVFHHKKFYTYKNEIFLPIHVGKSLSNSELDMQGDDLGINISEKNPYFCELTGLYWAWKNLDDVDYVGSMHYQRYFLNKTIFTNICLNIFRALYRILRLTKSDRIIAYLGMNLLFQVKVKHDFDKRIGKLTSDIINDTTSYDIILPKKEYLSFTAYQQYEIVHNVDDLNAILGIIQNKYSEVYPYFNDVIHKKYLIPCNIFIMKKQYFNKYMSFLFDVLFEFAKAIDLDKIPDNYQKRVFGFLSERMLAPYIAYLIDIHKVKIKYYDIMLLTGC